MEFILDSVKLQQCVPTNRNHLELFRVLNDVLPKYEINTVSRVAGFLAQCGHESGDFNTLEENLNYSAEGLLTTFKKYFKTLDEANHYARQPEKIANHVYSNRLGNGDESSGDGWLYRGRGAIQLTGYSNYKLFSLYVGKTIPDTVEYCKTIEGAIEASCWFWNINGLNRTCDNDDIVTMTKIINGGNNGIDDRRYRYERNKRILP